MSQATLPETICSTKTSPSVMPVIVVGLAASLATWGAIILYYNSKIADLKARHDEVCHRVVARILMSSATNDRAENRLPLAAYSAALPFAQVQIEPDGSRRYTWMNYAEEDDRTAEGHIAGQSWIIVDSENRVCDIEYIPAIY